MNNEPRGVDKMVIPKTACRDVAVSDLVSDRRPTRKIEH